jgi:hypothetical protein
MEAVRTSETSVDNHFTRQYNPEDSSEHYNVVDFHLHHQCQESRERHAASLSELTVYFVEHIDHRTEYETVASKQKPVISPRWTV